MIYLDNNATTKIDPRVLEVMFAVAVGNPSSPHRYGQKARQLLLEAKETILEHLNMPQAEIVFTSGGTEALNLGIHGIEGHMITSSLEHAVVLEACTGDVTYIDPPAGRGSITAKQIQEAIRPSTKLICVMAANNETGVKTELDAIAALGIPLLIDGVAFLGKEEWKMPKGICAVAFSAHKIHGPMGVGCLIFDKRFPVKPLIRGGAQQQSLRGGTENLPGIVGFAKAVELIDFGEMKRLRDHFEQELERQFDVIIHGKQEDRICNTSNVAFLEQDAELLLMQLDLAGIAVSYGAACSTGSLKLSHVLQNMGVPSHQIRSSLRFSLSRMTTQEEIDFCLRQLSKLLTPTDLTPSKLVSSAVNSN